MRSTASFLLGVAVGATAVMLVKRLREVVDEEDAEAIADRLSEQLQELEARTTGGADSAATRRRKRSAPST